MKSILAQYIDFHTEIKYNIGTKVGASMEIENKVYELLKRQNGFFTCSQAQEAGISKSALADMVEKNILERAAHGIYISADSFGDDMFIKQIAVPKLIYSHETALFLHELTDRTPNIYSVTVPSNYKPSKRILDSCKVYYVSPDIYLLGVTEKRNGMGNLVRVYDKDRTICDVLRSRNRMDIQVMTDAIRQYAAAPEKDLNKLYHYAEQFKVTKILRQYMEVLL